MLRRFLDRWSLGVKLEYSVWVVIVDVGFRFRVCIGFRV